MATAWDKDLGVSQGRIPVVDAPDGAFVYELGHALRASERINFGDFHEVKQSLVIDAQTGVVRMAVRVVPPDALPSGHFWEVSVRLNAVVVFTRRLTTGRFPVDLMDMAIPLSNSLRPAPDEIAVRLELVN